MVSRLRKQGRNLYRRHSNIEIWHAKIELTSRCCVQVVEVSKVVSVVFVGLLVVIEPLVVEIVLSVVQILKRSKQGEPRQGDQAKTEKIESK